MFSKIFKVEKEPNPPKTPGDPHPTDFTTQFDLLKDAPPEENQGLSWPFTNRYVAYQLGAYPDKRFMRGSKESMRKEAVDSEDKAFTRMNNICPGIADSGYKYKTSNVPTLFLKNRRFLDGLFSRNEHVVAILPLQKNGDDSNHVVAAGIDRGTPGKCYTFDVNQKSGEKIISCDQQVEEFTGMLNRKTHLNPYAFTTIASVPKPLDTNQRTESYQKAYDKVGF